MLVEFACLEGSIRPTFFSKCNIVLMDQVILVTTFAAPFLLSMSSPGFPVYINAHLSVQIEANRMDARRDEEERERYWRSRDVNGSSANAGVTSASRLHDDVAWLAANVMALTEVDKEFLDQRISSVVVTILCRGGRN